MKLELKLIFMDLINDLFLHCEYVGVKVIFLTYCIIINHLTLI